MFTWNFVERKDLKAAAAAAFIELLIIQSVS